MLHVERYLELDMLPIYKRALACFRCSSHKLNIEYGRHCKTNREERICVFYFPERNLAVIEDEFHAFFVSEKYGKIRTDYLYSWYNGRPTIENLYLLSNDNSNIIKRVGIYVKKSIDLKSQ